MAILGLLEATFFFVLNRGFHDTDLVYASSRLV